MNIIVNTLKGEEALVNWDNVTSVTKPKNDAEGQTGDAGEYFEINFVNKRSIVVHETLSEIKEKIGGLGE